MNVHARLAEQEAARITAIATVQKLRRSASDEIERLLAFLDETDGYTTNELESTIGSNAGEEDLEGDDSELEPSLCGIGAAWQPSRETSVEDGEDDDEREPSLGSLNSYGGTQAVWGAPGKGVIDAEDEHDGAEPENEHGDGEPDMEPMLGWTEQSGGLTCGSTSTASDECEKQDHLPLPRLRRIAKGIKRGETVGPSHLLTGLSDRQCELLDSRLPRYVLSDRTPGRRRFIF